MIKGSVKRKSRKTGLHVRHARGAFHKKIYQFRNYHIGSIRVTVDRSTRIREVIRRKDETGFHSSAIKLK